MSTTIDSRVVEMKFDNKQFESNVATSMSTLSKLKQSLNLTGASKGLESVGAAAKGINLSPLSGAAETVGLKFNAMYTMADQALRNIVNSAMTAGKNIVNALTIDPIKTGLSEYETQINAVQTILANTQSKGTTLDQVNSALDELNTYADKTIYNFTEMTRNIGTFTAAGVDLDTSVSAIQGIANLAAVSGSTSQQASTAMYQLSQALASGTVKLMDWNSVVNAGMGGQVFQDALKRTAENMGTDVDALIKKYGSFRETLQTGWITSDVLTTTLEQFTMAAEEGTEQWEAYKKSLMDDGYTAKQAEEILKMANTATEAATKVKTFTQLWDTLKETAQSGWTQTWEIILGDFEGAKTFFSDAYEKLSPMLEASAKARNDFLAGGLGTMWDAQVADGHIFDEKAWSNVLTNVAKENGVAIDDLIEKHGSFEATLQEGWLTSDIYSKAVGRTIKTLEQMSDAELKAAGYTRENVEELKTFKKSIDDGTVSLDELTASMAKQTGRQNLIDSIWNIVEAISSVVAPIKEAFRDIFPATTAEQLYKFTEIIKGFTEKLILSDEASKNLKSTFKGVFAVLDIVRMAFGAVFEAIKPLFGGLDDLGGGILGVTASWGDWLVSLRDSIQESGVFTEAAQKIADYIRKAGSAIKAFADTAKEKFDTAKEKFEGFINTVKENVIFPGLEAFQAFLERVGDRLASIKESAGIMKTGVIGAIEAMSYAFANCDFIKLLGTLWEGVKTLGSGIADAFGSLTGGFVEMLGNADFSGALDIINSLIAGGVGVGIMNFLKSTSDTIKGLQDITDGIVDVFDGVRGCLEAYQTQLKAGTLMKIAGAIAILAAALLVLALIDSEKLNSAIGAITMLFAELVGSMAIIDKMSGGFKTFSSITTSMVTMSVAVLILAAALKTIGSLDPGDMLTGLVGVIGLTGTLVAVMKILGSNSGTAVKGALQMVIFAAAVKVLASVCEDLAALSWEQLAKGLVGVGVLLTAVSLFMKTADTSGSSIRAATGIVILAAAIKVLASACEDFGGMKWGEIGKGLVAIGVLLAEVSAFTNLTGNAKHVISTGIALIAIGAAMKIFASACSDFAQMSWDELGRGLFAIAGALLAVTMAARTMPTNLISTGAGLVVVAAALVILTGVMERLGGMEWGGIAKGLVAIGGAMAILAVGLHLMSGTLGGSAAMLVAAVALGVLTPVLLTLGNISWEGIAKGLITIAGAFIIIGIAGAILQPLVPAILGLGAAFALVGVGILGIGAGLMLAATGLTALAVGFEALTLALAGGATAITAALTVIVVGVANLIPLLMEKLGEGILALCQVIIDGAPAIEEAIRVLVESLINVLVDCVPAIAEGALQVVVGVLDALAEYTPQIVDSLMQFVINVINGIAERIPELIQSVVNLLMSVFTGIVDALKGIDTSVLLEGLLGIGIMAALMLALSAVAALVPGAMLGVLGMGLVVAELALVLAAIGALAQIPGLNWLIEEGGNLLQSIGTAIGQFIGGIVGGVAAGVTSSFPQIGSDLSAFMTNAQAFIDGAKNIDESMLNGVKALAEVILLLTAADILAGITSWITGGNSMADFGTQLVPFGEAMKAFSDTVTGIDEEAVTAAANAGKIMAEMQNSIYGTDGIVQWFCGEKNMTTFGAQLVAFGSAIVSFSNTVSGNINEEAVTAAANAGKMMVEMQSNLVGTGGVVQWFTGEKNMSTFGAQLVAFGNAIVSFSNTVAGSINEEAITAAASAGSVMAELQKNLEPMGGVVDFFTGEKNLEEFGTQIVSFGNAIVAFSEAVAGNINSEAVTAAANAGMLLTDLQKAIPEDKWFDGKVSIDDFGKSISKFGGYIADYSNEVAEIDTGVVSNSITAANRLVSLTKSVTDLDTDGISSFKKVTGIGDAMQDYSTAVADVDSSAVSSSISAANRLKNLINSLADLDTSGVSSFKSAITSLGDVSLAGIIETFSAAADELSNVGSNLIDSLANGMKSRQGTLTSTLASISDTMNKTVMSKAPIFTKGGVMLMTNLVKGVVSQKGRLLSATRSAATTAANGLRSSYTTFYSAGGYLVSGFAAGISANTYRAVAKARAMAAAAASAARNALDIHSPSRVGYEIGDFFGIGFVNAIGDNVRAAYKSSSEMANSAKNGLSDAVSKIRDFIESDDDYQPTIRPVLDLSNVKSGAGTIGNMLGFTPSVGVLANVGAINSMMNRRNQNGVNDDVVAAIDKLRKEWGSLERNSYSIGNLSYEEGSAVSEAIEALVRAVRMEGRT